MMTITAKIPEPLNARMEAVIRQRRMTKSAFLRQAIEQALKDGGAKRRPTFGQVAGHLAGCLSGPGDLSTNPKHMEGYGE